MNERKKGTRLESFLDNYVVLDLETTSANIYTAKIIEVAAIKIKNGEVIESFESLVNPRLAIPPMATAVNHITDDMVKDSPYIEEVLEEFMQFIDGEILLGHNITTFDLNILYDVMKREFDYTLDNDFIDTLYLSQKCNDCVENYKLQTLSEYYGLDIRGEHRALKDCYLTNMCYQKLKEEYDEHGFVRCRKANTKKSRNYNIQYSKETKSLQELQGFLKGIMADDILMVSEVEKLNEWMQNNKTLKGNYPFDRVYEALEDVLEDGIIEPNELVQLENIFKEFISPADQREEVVIKNLTDKHCCLTGEFEAGSKVEIGKRIEENGGICDASVKKCTDYLVVGALGSQSWKQGTYGGKIKKAMEMKEKGSEIQVIVEQSFLRQLESSKKAGEKYMTQDEMEIFIPEIEEKNSWEQKVQQMLDKLALEWELPKKSLYLGKNVGRVLNEITSYSVCIYEPEYPKIPNRNMDQSRNSVVMNIKENKDKLELIIGMKQYEAVGNNEELQVKKLKSDPSNIHVIMDKLSDTLVHYIRVHTEYRIRHYSSKASTFGCCSSFNQCSDTKKCVHVNRLYAMACSYRHHLDAGEIFYGKNRNVD